MTLDPEIDMRMLTRHWVHAFAVDIDGHRSIQVFDAAGVAVHKVHLRESTDLAAFAAVTAELALPDQQGLSDFAPRPAPEGARIVEDNISTLRQEWARMTDTHQFDRLVHRLKMNRLGPIVRRARPWSACWRCLRS
ncbi:ChuX/HutX family heme-like substrate-binding protein [Paracoccus seriniphilus]|uniref:Haemin-degrading HemS.ChuX domain-containing protein n=1 Tax=Paracoccus seriniphilus TaxID=184748 RepID=A0A239Q192_9RHOB|nr:ChuX/HutX family heme-like substrate-binding protein [Paracoccus seriniphilus]SNT76200.1 Haemin-degrading HemS.ChuX domain-containing protein [Paracoccus seriniphilus]